MKEILIITSLLGAGVVVVTIPLVRAWIKNAHYTSIEGLSIELLKNYRERLLKEGFLEKAKEFERYRKAYEAKKSLLTFFIKYKISCYVHREGFDSGNNRDRGFYTVKEYCIEENFSF